MLGQLIDELATGSDESKRRFNLYTGLTIEKISSDFFGNMLFRVTGEDYPTGRWFALRELHSVLMSAEIEQTRRVNEQTV